MTPKLTPELRDALERSDGPLAVEDAVNNRVYFLVDESTYTNLHHQEDFAAIHEGIVDMEAGRVVSLEQLDERIRKRIASFSK
jgi:hypothetical protein